MHAHLTIALCLAFFSLSAQALDMYRWVDEKGKTHYSDSVPKKYKHSAKRLDSRHYELSEAQRREKAEQASKNLIGPPLPNTAPDPELTHDRNQAAFQSNPQNGTGAGQQTDCASLRWQYMESQECFERFRNANGSIKAEAFQHCTAVTDPTPKCGPIVMERY